MCACKYNDAYRLILDVVGSVYILPYAVTSVEEMGSFSNFLLQSHDYVMGVDVATPWCQSQLIQSMYVTKMCVTVLIIEINHFMD